LKLHNIFRIRKMIAKIYSALRAELHTLCALLLTVFVFLHPAAGLAASNPPLPPNECELTNAAISTQACLMQPGVGPNGAVGNQSLDAGGPNYVGTRSLSLYNADTAIHAYGYCIYVNNQSAKTIFVPFNSQREIMAFISDLPPGVTAIDCSVPGQVMVPPNFLGVPQANQCANNPPSQPVNVPNYAPYANKASAIATYTGSPATPFSCTSPDGTAFTETATATCSQQDSNNPVTQVGWVPTTIVYTYDGMCGAANGVASVTAPATDLCHVGVALNAPAQDGSGNWAWTCFGGNGPNSHNASCSATGSLNGQCNNVLTSTPSSTMPGGNLCSAGTPGPVSGGLAQGGATSPWTWSCTGSGGGSTASCSEPYAATPTDGKCDPGTNGVATPTAPSGNLCTAGTPGGIGGGATPGGVTIPWTWTCAGLNGGKTASCSAPDNAPAPVNGACDATAENTATNSAPSGTLCDTGTAANLGGGNGSNWTWSCDGSGGGANASCLAAWIGLSCTQGATTYPDGSTWITKTHGHSGKCTTNVTSTYSCSNGSRVLVARSSQLDGGSCDSCFPPDTPVLTVKHGWQPISHIAAGDKVVSFNAKGHHTIATVQRLQITPDRMLRRINGVNISTLQKVQLATGEYKRVEALQIGDVLVDTDNKPHPITSLEDVPGMFTVYNLVMKNHHIPFYAAGVRVKDWQ
jgi:hypothetical protein